MSYAFQRDCSGAVKYQQQAFDLQLARNDYTDAAGAANEVARVCLGSRTASRKPRHVLQGLRHGPERRPISPPRRTSWQFRWEHAQARIAARRGQKTEADKHVAAAKAVLDKGTNPEQAPYRRISSATWRFTAATTRPRLRNCRKPIRTTRSSSPSRRSREAGRGRQGEGAVPENPDLRRTTPANACARPLAAERLKAKVKG